MERLRVLVTNQLGSSGLPGAVGVSEADMQKCSRYVNIMKSFFLRKSLDERTKSVEYFVTKGVNKTLM